MDYELHPHEVKILRVLDKKSTPDEIAKIGQMPLDAVMRASSWLGTKSLVKIEEKIIEEIVLDKEGILYKAYVCVDKNGLVCLREGS